MVENYEKAFTCYERALQGKERVMGKNHPLMLDTVLNIAIVYCKMNDFGKAEELFERALEGYEAQLGKDHEDAKRCAQNLAVYFS